MGKGADVARAAREIERALRDFVGEDERDLVRVFESFPGHLRAAVGSVKFKGVGVTQRQELIWDHLKKKVSAENLAFCWGVYPLDPDEYYDEYYPQSSSLSAGPDVDSDVD